MPTSEAQLHLDALSAPRWSRVRRVSLIRREVREFLAPNAFEILFSAAEVVVESGRDGSDGAVYATVMVTLDLRACVGLARERIDAATAHRMGELLRNDRRTARRMAQYARPYLCEAAERSLRAAEIELDFDLRTDDCHILIDGDAMVRVKGASGVGRG